jgi:hypothetical protein
MPVTPAKCKICGHEHWQGREPHVFPQESRPRAPQPAQQPLLKPQVQVLPVTDSVTSVTDSVTSVTIGVTGDCICPLCGAGHRSRGPMSAAERQRASRARARMREET